MQRHGVTRREDDARRAIVAAEATVHALWLVAPTRLLVAELRGRRAVEAAEITWRTRFFRRVYSAGRARAAAAAEGHATGAAADDDHLATSHEMVQESIIATRLRAGKERAQQEEARRNRVAFGVTQGGAHRSLDASVESAASADRSADMIPFVGPGHDHVHSARDERQQPPPTRPVDTGARLSEDAVAQLAAEIALSRRRLSDAESVWRLVLLEQAAANVAMLDPDGHYRTATAAGQRDAAFASAAATAASPDALSDNTRQARAESTWPPASDDQQRLPKALLELTDTILQLLHSCKPPTQVFTLDVCQRFASRLAAGRRRCIVSEADCRSVIVEMAALTRSQRSLRADIVTAEAQWRGHICATMAHHRPIARAAEATAAKRRRATAAALQQGPMATNARLEAHGRELIERANDAWREVTLGKFEAGPSALDISQLRREASALEQREDAQRGNIASAERQWFAHISAAEGVAARRLKAAARA